MTDLERAHMYEADRLWASVVKETGIWMSPYAEQVADFGRLLIPKMRDALTATRREAAVEMRERAADQAHLVWGDGQIAASIRALPLTPEGEA